MKNLIEAVRVLSLPGEQQLASQPSGSAKADELALGFDDAFRFWKPRRWSEFSEEEKSALAAIDAALAAMSDEKNGALWSEDAVRHDPRWQRLREKAQAALTLLHE